VNLNSSTSQLTRCFAALVIAFAAATANAGDEADFSEVLKLYHQAKFAGAYGRFCALADRGHPEAARIALFMLRYGKELYGSDWSASQGQIDGWTALAARNPVRIVESTSD
jgi:hypothetical protein